ncbi:MAG: M56 family metallopeptidase [Ferruginibacter sp.]
MHLPVFDNALLLQSTGWAIMNSFWQVGSLWLLYKCINAADKKLPAIIKYNLSIVLLFTSLFWFLCTIINNYLTLSNIVSSQGIIKNVGWLYNLLLMKDILPLLAICYFVLLSFYVIPYVKSLSKTFILQKKGLTKAPVALRIFTQQTALHLGIKQKVQLWISTQVSVPSIAGYIKPVILIPVAMLNQLSVNQVEAIILHELAHIKRNDYFVNIIQTLVDLMLFFNPFARLLSQVAKAERENCCDDWVMNFRYNHYDYANALIILEENRTSNATNFVLAATDNKKKLLKRIKRLFAIQPQTEFNKLQKLLFSCLVIGLMLITIHFHPNFNRKISITTINAGETSKHFQNWKSHNENIDQSHQLIFASAPVRTTTTKSKVKSKRNRSKLKEIIPQQEYINAFINEELLNNVTPIEPVVSQVVEKEVVNSKYFVTIEDEESGNKPASTYYFELDNKAGIPSVKPLLVLKRIKHPGYKLLKKIPNKNLRDSLSLPKNTRKKITTS